MWKLSCGCAAALLLALLASCAGHIAEPQQAVDSSPPAFNGFPTLNDLDGQRLTASVPATYSRNGADFDIDLGHLNVTAEGTNGNFEPSGQPEQPQLAFAVYRFSTAMWVDSQVSFDWSNHPGQDHLWIGVPDWSTRRWNWFANPAGDTLDLANLADFRSDYGEVWIAVVVMDEAAELTKVHIDGTNPDWIHEWKPLLGILGINGAVYGNNRIYVYGQTASFPRSPAFHIVCFDTVGGFVWARQLTCPDYYLTCSNVALTPTGDLIAIGSGQSSQGNPSISLVAALDQSGNMLWQHSYGKTIGEYSEGVFLSSVAVSQDGSAFICGSERNEDYESTPVLLKLDSGGNTLSSQFSSVFTSLIAADGDDFILAGEGLLKLDQSGGIVWQHGLSGFFDYFYANDLQLAADGSIWLAGKDGQSEGSETARGDAILLKHAADGTLLFSRRWGIAGGGGKEQGYAVTLTDDTAYLMINTFSGGGIPGGGRQASGTTAYTASGAYVLRYGLDGTLQRTDRLTSGFIPLILQDEASIPYLVSEQMQPTKAYWTSDDVSIPETEAGILTEPLDAQFTPWTPEEINPQITIEEFAGVVDGIDEGYNPGFGIARGIPFPE